MNFISRATIVAAILAIVGCASTETPAGQAVLSHTFDEASAATTDPESHQIQVDLPDEAGDVSVTFDVEAGTAPDGRMIRELSATVDKSGGWTISVAEPSPPLNLGTADAPVMAATVIVTRHRKKACSEHARQTSVTIKADGSHTVN